jgi:hypothetical protein
LDDERHDEVIHVESPSILECEVWLDVFIAGIESSSEVFFFLSFDKEF